jgi:hypothetical protein
MLSMLAGRYYLDRSELMEMFVECEGSFDAQSIYHHVTYAVGEAPLLIMERSNTDQAAATSAG